MRKITKIILIGLGILTLALVCFFFLGTAEPAPEIRWGVNFSQKHAHYLGLNWRQNYLAILNELGARKIKLATHWDLLEPQKDQYSFKNLDWQIGQAEQKGAKILLVIGMKTPRWPECHIPEWAQNLNKEELQEQVLELIKQIVLRYRDSKAIEFWQVENEPFFPFGECPPFDKYFLQQEIDLVKSLDSNHPVIITESGEWSPWLKAARLGDVVGVTLYRTVWIEELGIYFTYPIPPVFYSRKAFLVKKLFNKDVICIELQAEPWGPKLLYDIPLEEQKKTMNLSQFKKNIDYAKKTGLDQFYLWGAEWWYWLKQKKNQPQIWNQAKGLF